jgi:regulator of cell morphogenesis and NO signaling
MPCHAATLRARLFSAKVIPVWLGPLFDKVCSEHGKNHPELQDLRATFRGLAQELTTHVMKEEAVLFPHIVRMEEAVIQKKPVLPPSFGSVQNPVTLMMLEHDSAGAALRALRQGSVSFTAPSDACISYQTLYKALADFEADLHQHIHLENNILFPRRDGTRALRNETGWPCRQPD